MNYNCDRRGGYGDSAEEAANLFLAASTRNPWQVGPMNPVISAGHHAGNVTNCNAASAGDAGTAQGAILFQGFLGGRGYGGSLQPSSAALHARCTYSIIYRANVPHLLVDVDGYNDDVRNSVQQYQYR